MLKMSFKAYVPQQTNKKNFVYRPTYEGEKDTRIEFGVRQIEIGWAKIGNKMHSAEIQKQPIYAVPRQGQN